MDIDALAGRIADSSLSVELGSHTWITPMVQSVHILAVAALMSAVLFTSLRALGVVGQGVTLARMSERYLPWIWAGLLVLLLTGATLVIGEPRRSLESPVFLKKMILLLLAIGLTVLVHTPLRGDQDFWQGGGRPAALRLIALVTLVVWVGIIFAGRWIAYAGT